METYEKKLDHASVTTYSFRPSTNHRWVYEHFLGRGLKKIKLLPIYRQVLLTYIEDVSADVGVGASHPLCVSCYLVCIGKVLKPNF